MQLVEKHIIKRKSSNKELFERIDSYCFAAKNLHNAANYVIKQSSRISRKLQQGKTLEDWEQKLLDSVNIGIDAYNNTSKSKDIKKIDENNGFIANDYFLSYWLKTTEEYKALPCAVSSQVCIQTLCRDWKAFFAAMRQYAKSPSSFLGTPKPPRYYDKEKGRGWIVLTTANKIKRLEDGYLKLPCAFNGLKVKARHDCIQQVRIKTGRKVIEVDIIYKADESCECRYIDRVMGIDIGVNNLVAATSNTEMPPFLINGRPLKSINQYYNKQKSKYQKLAKTLNNRHITNRIIAMSEARNNKVKDFMHNASRMVVNEAIRNNIGLIVIGKNREWKQEVHLGRRNNQTFVSIPFNTFIQMITYKAKLVGIRVVVVEEKYTSGTSYLDNEMPIKENYNKKRRKKRGLFVSNRGICINADVNASYQIMKKMNGVCVPVKKREKIKKMKVA